MEVKAYRHWKEDENGNGKYVFSLRDVPNWVFDESGQLFEVEQVIQGEKKRGRKKKTMGNIKISDVPNQNESDNVVVAPGELAFKSPKVINLIFII